MNFPGRIGVFLGSLVWCAGMLPAQGQPYHMQVFQPIASDVSRPLRELAPHILQLPAQAQAKFLGRIPFTGPTASQPDPVLQTSTPASPAYGGGLSVAGLGVGFSNFAVQYAPPDTNGAVGATQYVQWVNTSYAIFDKSSGAAQSIGGKTYFPGNTPWAGFGGPCETNNDGDPIIQYDKAANRWIFTQFSVSKRPYLQCFAISTTSDPTGPYLRFAFSFGNKDFPDYPKLGVWSDAYYMSFNIFGNGAFFSGPRACAIDRDAIINNTAPTMVCYQLSSSTGSLLPSDLDGNTPPPGPAYFTSFGNNSLQVWRFQPNFANPSSSSFTGPTNLSVAPFSPACGGGACIPQLGTSQQLDSLGDRLMYRLAYRNFGDHEALVVTHSIQAPSAASAIRWYELRVDGQHPGIYVYQQGTYAPDSLSRWMGSIAMDQSGNIAVGYSASSGSAYPSIRIAGRSPGDPRGQLQSETTIIGGTGSQNGGLNRWGDYSSMTLDPSSDCTFWYTNEYLKNNGSFNWSTNISTLTFSSCGTTPPPAPSAPTNLSATAATSPVQINLAWTAGSSQDGIYVERSTDGTNFSYLATVPGASANSYSDTNGLQAGTTYYYRVYAYSSGGLSDYSNVASAAISGGSGVPNAPSNLTATQAKGKKSVVNLSWTDNSTNEDSFILQRCAGAGCSDFAPIATPSTNTTSYRDSSVSSGTTYQYRVAAHNASGDSTWSNTAVVTIR